MSERRVRIGVVGAGRFAEECHIPGIQDHPQGDVVALWARNRERVAALAARFGVPDVHTDYRDLIARPDIDAVTVATPDALHLPMALAALERGKHVFCEKPLAMDAAEAERMAAAVEQSGLVGMVAFTFRYTRALPAVRRLLAAGEIGTPFYVALQVHWGSLIAPKGELAWRDRAAESAAGIWGDGASHLFDALAYALAPAEEVCAQVMIVPREEGAPQPDSLDLATALARLRLPASASASARDTTPEGYADRSQRAVHVTMLTSRVDAPRVADDNMYVVGTRGAASLSLTRGAHERLSIQRPGGNWEDAALPADAYGDAPLALPRMMGAFVDAVLRGRLDPDQDPGFAAGLHAQRALEAGLRSAHSGHWEPV